MRLPICGCGRIMNVETTGLNVLTHTEQGEPYQLWSADEYKCADCGAKVAMVAAMKPIAEHWEAGFQRAVRHAEAPGGRSRLTRAYYRARLEDGGPNNIAGVKLGPIVKLAIDSHLRAAGLHPDPIPAPASSVDSTTPPADDAQHHGSTTSEPEAR